jgi:hypothetical protein
MGNLYPVPKASKVGIRIIAQHGRPSRRCHTLDRGPRNSQNTSPRAKHGHADNISLCIEHGTKACSLACRVRFCQLVIK